MCMYFYAHIYNKKINKEITINFKKTMNTVNILSLYKYITLI